MKRSSLRTSRAVAFVFVSLHLIVEVVVYFELFASLALSIAGIDSEWTQESSVDIGGLWSIVVGCGSLWLDVVRPVPLKLL